MARHPILPPRQDYAMVTAEVADIAHSPAIRRRWWMAMAAALPLVAAFLASTGLLLWLGTGVWGINIPVNWGLAIINTVWWVGIGHAGTLISSLLLLMGEGWRNSLNRFAEAMTLFAAMMAGLFPILHLGRPELFYWNFPIPSTFGVWPQFRSPLAWDFFSFVSYILVSLAFWYVGLIPDLATLRDRSHGAARAIYGALALGWRGSAVHWARWRQAYLGIAAAAFHLVISVHSGVAMLFAGGPIPGWHTSVFPPYFVFGAVFSGFAVVIMLAIGLRTAFRLAPLITPRHLDILGRLLLATGLLTLYGYLADAFHAWYSGDAYEIRTLLDRVEGEYAWSAWTAVALNFGAIQLLWWRRARGSQPVLFAAALSVAAGMWFERYMLIVSGLYRDYLPSSWHIYDASLWEWLLFAGTVGVFAMLFLLFARWLPMVSIFEVKEVLEREGKG